MRNARLLAALVACSTAAVAQAQVTQLTFEGLKDQEVIGNFYNGGLAGGGSGPGPSSGVTFGTTALAVISSANGGAGNFQSAPSGSTIMFFLTANNTFMDVAGGFSGGFSLFYSAIAFPGAVQVWSGAGGTGTMLGSTTLSTTPSQPGTPGCPGAQQYCPWVAASVAFSGTAQSVVFSGSANFIGFDNVTFGSTDPSTTTTPEPATLALVAGGLAAVAVARRRRRS